MRKNVLIELTSTFTNDTNPLTLTYDFADDLVTSKASKMAIKLN